MKCIGISIPCQSVTPAVSPISRSVNGAIGSQKQKVKNGLTIGMKHTRQHLPMESCTSKLDRYNDRKISGFVNRRHYSPTVSIQIFTTVGMHVVLQLKQKQSKRPEETESNVVFIYLYV
jgi:hypothetical protein